MNWGVLIKYMWICFSCSWEKINYSSTRVSLNPWNSYSVEAGNLFYPKCTLTFCKYFQVKMFTFGPPKEVDIANSFLFNAEE
jgi:hypothetical protein